MRQLAIAVMNHDGRLAHWKMESPHDELFRRIQSGDDAAKRELIAITHEELRRLAGLLMSGQPGDHTLQATALVSETCLKLMRNSSQWHDYRHYLSLAATTMRNLLIDHARGKRTKRRNRPYEEGTDHEMDALLDSFEHRSASILDLHEALERLRQRKPAGARLVDLRFFGGAKMEECAAVLGVSLRQTQRLWQEARGLLRLDLEDEDEQQSG